MLELALLPAEGPALLVGLARLLHHLDLLFLLPAATAAAAAAAALLLGNDSTILRIFVGTLLFVPAAFLAALGVVGRTLVALIFVVGISHGRI